MSGRKLVRIGGYAGSARLDIDGVESPVFATIDCYRPETGEGQIIWSGRLEGDDDLAMLVGVATLVVDGQRGDIMLRSLGSFVGDGPPPIDLAP